MKSPAMEEEEFLRVSKFILKMQNLKPAKVCSLDLNTKQEADYRIAVLYHRDSEIRIVFKDIVEKDSKLAEEQHRQEYQFISLYHQDYEIVLDNKATEDYIWYMALYLSGRITP